MIALDIEAIQPLAEFDARMEQLIEQLKAVPLAKGFDEIVYPGRDRGAERREKSRGGADPAPGYAGRPEKAGRGDRDHEPAAVLSAFGYG